MNGVVFLFDHQYQISNLDFAVLRELGYKLTTYVADDLTDARTSDILWQNSIDGSSSIWIMNGTSLARARRSREPERKLARPRHR